MKKYLLSPIGIVAVLAVPTLLFSWYIATREVDDVQLTNSDPGVRRNRTQVIGGVERPISDITSVRAGAPRSEISKKTTPDKTPVEYHFGPTSCPRVPKLSKGQNPQMDSVIEALDNGDHPERLSPIHEPVKFDVEAWKANPNTYCYQKANISASSSLKSEVRLVAFQEDGDSYLDTAEPGRIYDTSEPGEEIPVLSNASASFFSVRDGEAVRLGVQTLPNAPVSLTAFGVGQFDNGLATITTLADENGVASSTFVTATGGDTIQILAGSPVATGNVRFIIKRESMF